MCVSEQTGIKKLEARQATEIADFYHVPQSLVDMFWVVLGGTAYPKLPFLVHMAQQKGLQRIDVEVAEKDGVWEATARIYPAVTSRMLENLVKLPENERKQIWEYMTKPTVEWGRASKETVRMSTLHPFLREMAIKRAVARACRLYSGVGTTAFEELPEAAMSRGEMEDATPMAKTVEAKVSDAPNEPVAPREPAPADFPLEERLKYDLSPFDGVVDIVPEADIVEIKARRTLDNKEYKALENLMRSYAPRTRTDGGMLVYTVAR